MRRFAILIRWRAFRWSLSGIARNSCDLLAGMLEHCPPGARLTVRPDELDHERRARDREEYARDMEPYTRPHRDGDVTP